MTKRPPPPPAPPPRIIQVPPKPATTNVKPVAQADKKSDKQRTDDGQ